MQFCYIAFVTLLLSCSAPESREPQAMAVRPEALVGDIMSYAELKLRIDAQRRRFAEQHADPGDTLLRDFWVRSLLDEFYPAWTGTPWDFNGTTQEPGQGAIACGYFVTTVLRDMGVKLQRIRLATCASSEMMKALVPGQQLKNLSRLSYEAFEEQLRKSGKGVYVIGLDFHTGFIVNDGAQCWFVHSYYVENQGVIKEPVSASLALRSSQTRWLVSLTGDVGFLQRWIEG